MAFQPFNSRLPLEKSRRHLPHWQQPGATYFVTFRLADSLPEEVRLRLEEMQRLNDQEAFAWVERYLDAGAGSCLLASPANADLVANALRHFDAQRYALGSFVVMPNHVHALVQPHAAYTLEAVVHGWKSYTANRLQRAAGIHGKVWQTESFDRIVRDEPELRHFHAYILANPRDARLPADRFVIGHGTAGWINL